MVEGAPEEQTLLNGLAAAGLPGSRVTRVRVLDARPSATFGRLSLVEATVGPPCAGFALCRALAALGHPVVGAVLPRPAHSAASPPAHVREGGGEGAEAPGVRTVEGGAHLCLIRMRFPPDFKCGSPGAEAAAGGATVGGETVQAAVEVPKKFLKLLKREVRECVFFPCPTLDPLW